MFSLHVWSHGLQHLMLASPGHKPASYPAVQMLVAIDQSIQVPPMSVQESALTFPAVKRHVHK